MLKSIYINWFEGPAKGLTDVLPLALFEKTGKHARATHSIRGPMSREYIAHFALDVTDTAATLDYCELAQANRKDEICLGILTVKFKDSTRSEVDDVLWEDSSGAVGQSITTYMMANWNIR